MRAFPSIVVIGGSDGGAEALSTILKHLPGTFAAPVLAAITINPRRLRRLPAILSRSRRLPVHLAADGDPIREGRVYLAPAEYQMIASARNVYLSDAARRLGYRSTIDPLFASAAVAFAERVIGVILSGASEDGVVGLRTIKRAGGITIVQEPGSAAFSRMPSSALATGSVDHVLPAREIGPALAILVHDSQVLRRTA